MKDSKEKIMKAYGELLYEHSYSKISVKDIVERCGMHRNASEYILLSFYGYSDIAE